MQKFDGVIKEWLSVYEDELKPKEALKFDDFTECEKFYKLMPIMLVLTFKSGHLKG